MRVTALLFNPPGRGEFLRKHFDMPDDAMPKSPEEFATRSRKAVDYFWPKAFASKGVTLDKCDGGKRYVVEGKDWSVEWATDEHVAEMRELMKGYMEGEIYSDAFLDSMMKVQPTERIEL